MNSGGDRDFQPHADREPALELFRCIAGIFSVCLDGSQQETVFDSFEPDGLDFSEFSIVIFDLPPYSLADNQCVLLPSVNVFVEFQVIKFSILELT
jgi:hypothetical protein